MVYLENVHKKTLCEFMIEKYFFKRKGDKKKCFELLHGRYWYYCTVLSVFKFTCCANLSYSLDINSFQLLYLLVKSENNDMKESFF